MIKLFLIDDYINIRKANYIIHELSNSVTFLNLTITSLVTVAPSPLTLPPVSVDRYRYENRYVTHPLLQTTVFFDHINMMLWTFVVTDLIELIDADILLSNFGHHSIWWIEITRKETSSFSLWWKKTNLTTSKSLPNISLTWINFMHVKLQLVLVWSSMMAFSLYHLFSWDCLCKQFFSCNWSQSSSNFNTFFYNFKASKCF